MEIMNPSNHYESLISPDEIVPHSKCRDSASGWLIFILSASTDAVHFVKQQLIWQTVTHQ